MTKDGDTFSTAGRGWLERLRIWTGERSLTTRGQSLAWAWLGWAVLFMASQVPIVLTMSGIYEIHVSVPTSQQESARQAIMNAARVHERNIDLVVTAVDHVDQQVKRTDLCGAELSRVGVRVYASAFSLPSDMVLKALAASGIAACGWGYQSPGHYEALPAIGGSLVAVAMFLMAALLLNRNKRIRAVTLPSQDAMSLKTLAWATAVGVAILVLPVLLVWSGAFSIDEHAALQKLAALPEARWALFISLVVFAPVIEEITFRYWLTSWLAHAVGRYLALYGGAVAFVLVHVPDSPLRAVSLAIAGGLLGWLWLRYRSLSANILAHGIANLAAFAAIAWAGL